MKNLKPRKIQFIGGLLMGVLLGVQFVLSVSASSYGDCPAGWNPPEPPCDTCPCPPGNAGGGGGGNFPPGASGGGGRDSRSGATRVGGSCNSCGMTGWKVDESQLNYRLFDTPLQYSPASGPAISLDLVYQTWRYTDFGYYPDNSSNPLFGTQWHCAWSSELQINAIVSVNTRTSWNYLGGRVIYTFNADPLLSDASYQNGSRVEIVKDTGGNVIGGRVKRSDGSVLEYFQSYSATQFLLTSTINTDGSFLQPAERFEGPNLYRFARNQPLTGIDPLGLAYGNPVSGPEGPIGPSNPYAPGGAYYCPPPDPCKGPPGGKAGPQDNICSIPGGSTLGGIEGDTGITKCCHQHDDCYAANGCNQNSWLPGCGSSACKQCNKNVVSCIVNVLFPYGPIIAL